MSRFSLHSGAVLYVNPEAGVRVLSGYLEPEHLPVAIKEQTFASMRAANLAVREAMALSSLSHPAIVRVYDCFLDQNEAGACIVSLVTELMDRDLGQEIDIRRAENRKYSQNDVFETARTLISALSYAESKGICHRDLKPQNIFVSGNRIKLGDFGASSQSVGRIAQRSSIQGSPFFLSPELKIAYAELLNYGQAAISVDPLKADVYSLGVTILYMALLVPPSGLMDIRRLETATSQAIQSIKSEYPDIVDVLEPMLRTKPEDRPSFSDLETVILCRQSTSIPAVPLPGNSSACRICSSAVSPFAKPRYLSTYEIFSENCCSVRCLEQHCGAWEQNKCVFCEEYMSVEDGKELECGHKVHTSACYNRLLERERNPFRKEILNCPKCHMETRLHQRPRSLLSKLFGST